MDEATIYALGTPVPSRAHPGAISVIRLSGPRAAEALIFLTERRAFERGHSARDPALPEPRRMVVRSLYDPTSGETIDRGLAVWFEAPNSETGETMAELHLHGGRAVVGGALDAIAKLGFCRMAEPGEFTRRAFENGKLDLTKAEAIADLVAAETDQQRRQALQQMDGALHRLYEDWRTLGLRTLAHLEAAIDFPDEDLPAGIADDVHAGITRLQAEIAAHLDDRRGERLREGLHIAIIGPPNAGKSIAAQPPGAPRRGHRVGDRRHDARCHRSPSRSRRLAGGAGRHGGPARRRAMPSSRRACAAPARARPAPTCACSCSMRRATGGPSATNSVASTERWDDTRDVVVVNKIDRAPVDDADVVPVSALSGDGLPDLLARIERAATALMQESGAPPLTRARHREALVECQASLARALTGSEIALAAEDVRLAMRALGRITGTVRIDELLDIIFRDFCIGK